MSITKNTEKTTEGLDRKEFEEWIIKYQEQYRSTLRIYGWTMDDVKNSFLASRRLLREQLGKWHDVEEFYKEPKDG